MNTYIVTNLLEEFDVKNIPEQDLEKIKENLCQFRRATHMKVSLGLTFFSLLTAALIYCIVGSSGFVFLPTGVIGAWTFGAFIWCMIKAPNSLDTDTGLVLHSAASEIYPYLLKFGRNFGEKLVWNEVEPCTVCAEVNGILVLKICKVTALYRVDKISTMDELRSISEWVEIVDMHASALMGCKDTSSIELLFARSKKEMMELVGC